MDQPLKKRLIGATILISLAIIFIPMLIGQAPPEQRSLSLEIPKASSDFNSRILALPEQAPAVLAAVEISPRGVVKTTEPVQLKKAKLVLPKPPKSQPVKEITAWVVQVGSFSAEVNADKLATKLKKAGYTAFVEPSSNSKGNVFRVRVGPEISQTKTKAMAEKIQKELKLSKALVVQYP